MQKYKETL